jgi:hypothetical protein
MTTVVSFYTPDWRYPEYAQMLQADCDRLGLAHHIQEMPSKHDYVQNCNMKPEFIRDMMARFKSPILWVDVDSSILHIPAEMLGVSSYDIVGVAKANDRLIFVSCLYFNYTHCARAFVDRWISNASDFIDDGAFQDTLIQDTDIKLLKLDSSCAHTILRAGEAINPTAFLINRLSSSDLKWAYKKQCEKK